MFEEIKVKPVEVASMVLEVAEAFPKGPPVSVWKWLRRMAERAMEEQENEAPVLSAEELEKVWQEGWNDPKYVIGYVNESDQIPFRVWSCKDDQEVDKLVKDVQYLFGRLIVTSDYREDRKPEPVSYEDERARKGVTLDFHDLADVMTSRHRSPTPGVVRPDAPGPNYVIPMTVPPVHHNGFVDWFGNHWFGGTDTSKWKPLISSYSVTLEDGNVHVKKIS